MATRTCPDCNTQYLATVRRCIDCDTLLVDDAAERTAADEARTESTEEACPGDGTVRLTLPGWGNQLKVTLDGMLQRSDIPHVWEAGDLVVPEAVRARVADLLDAVEGRSLEALDAGDGGDEERIALEIEGLEPEHLDALDGRLLASSIRHAWSDDGDLVIAASDEPDVLAMIDAVFSDDQLEGDDIDVAARLTDLYVAVDRLESRIGDERAESAYEAAVERVRHLPVPYGFDGAAWSDLVGRAIELIASDDEPADDESSAVDEADPSAGDAASGPEDEASSGEATVDTEPSSTARGSRLMALRDELREIV